MKQHPSIALILFFLLGVFLIDIPDDRGWVGALKNNIGVLIVFIAGMIAAEPESESESE